MRYLIGLLLAVTTLLCRQADAAQPQMQSFDFGSSWPGSFVRHTFVFHNTGAGSWTVIGSHSSCSCGVVEKLPATVAAGADLAVPIAFNIRGERESQSRGQITVSVSDASGVATELVCIFMATSAGTLLLPGDGHLVLAPLPHDAPPRIDTVHLKRGSNPAAWHELAARVDSGSEVLAARAMATSAGGWDLLLTTSPSHRLGVVMAVVALTCSEQGKALPFVEHLTITITVDGAVHAEPSAVLFGAVPAGESRSAEVALTDHQERTCTITATVSSDPRCRCTVAADGATVVTLSGAPPEGNASGWIDLTTAAGIVRVPYFAAVLASPGPRQP